MVIGKNTNKTNLQQLAEDFKDRKRMVLFLGAGINFGDKIKLGNNKDIDLSWDGLLHGVFAEAFSLLSIGKDFSSADREILQSLISSKDSQEAAEGFSEKETECLES